MKFKNINDLLSYIHKMSNGGQQPTAGSIDWRELSRRQAWAESGFRNSAVSSANAEGMFQITPAVHQEYMKAGGRGGDLKDPNYNKKVRDWYIDSLSKRGWVNKENPTDSIKAGKILAAYNYGSTNTVNALNKAKQEGINIYNTFDWVSTKYLPKETVDYINWILRNKNTSLHRNNFVYDRNKYKYPWKH